MSSPTRLVLDAPVSILRAPLIRPSGVNSTTMTKTMKSGVNNLVRKPSPLISQGKSPLAAVPTNLPAPRVRSIYTTATPRSAIFTRANRGTPMLMTSRFATVTPGVAAWLVLATRTATQVLLAVLMWMLLERVKLEGAKTQPRPQSTCMSFSSIPQRVLLAGRKSMKLCSLPLLNHIVYYYTVLIDRLLYNPSSSPQPNKSIHVKYSNQAKNFPLMFHLNASRIISRMTKSASTIDQCPYEAVQLRSFLAWINVTTAMDLSRNSTTEYINRTKLLRLRGFCLSCFYCDSFFFVPSEANSF